MALGGIYYYDKIQTAIDHTFEATQALCKHLRVERKLKENAQISDDANNAAVAAFEAKTIFDREFRGKEVNDPATPGHKMVPIETGEQARALTLMTSKLRTATNLVRDIKVVVGARLVPDPDAEPRRIDDEAPDVKILKTIEKHNITATNFDVLTLLGDAGQRLRVRREAER